MANKVALKKGNEITIGTSTKVYKLLGLETPETIRRWIRKFRKTKSNRPINKNGYEVFTNITEL